MKVSELWLREWVNPALDVQQLAALLTMAGLEVDEVSPVAGQFDGVVVAEVVNTKAHPQANKLTVCEVNNGSGKLLKIVCGAANVRNGLKVALAQVGANLPNNIKIKEAVLRGEPSQGMLCSQTELGLSEHSEGILELDEDAPVGTNLRDYLHLDDTVLDIDLTPNRADCLSVMGIAREISALSQTPLSKINIKPCPPALDEQLTIKLEAEQACPQYCGRIIRGIHAQAVTPLWMKERLNRSGIRSIHPVVDVTNYVMLELGQPMHAFNLQRLQGGIIVRMAKKGEKLDLLDGQQVILEPDVLVIADNKQALAMAGVMGGADSAVDDTVTDIFLESAFFAPRVITGIARRYGLTTDSSQRFERGVDPTLQVTAMERATALLLEIAGGNAGPLSLVTVAKLLPSQQSIAFNPAKVKKLTGLDIADAEMLTMLQGLAMEVDSKQLPWRVKAPSHRFDISLDVDLVEEIIRLYGYDRIPGATMVAPVRAGTINPAEKLGHSLARFFSDRAYNETISYSFVDPEIQKVLYPQKETMDLLNPISPELSQMRMGMWPGLLAAMVYNTHRQQPVVKIFERGVIFEVIDGQLQEHPAIAGLLTGETGALNWSETTHFFDFYDLKGDLQALFKLLHLDDIQFVMASHPALHPGKAAQILINGLAAGWCGVLNPRINNALDCHEEVIVFELRLETMLQQKPVRYQTISKFPSIRRDLSLLVADSIEVCDIERVIRQTFTQPWLTAFNVFDIYTGDTIPAGKKSVAIALVLQDTQRTLVDNEINQAISAIIKKLDAELGITLRE